MIVVCRTLPDGRTVGTSSRFKQLSEFHSLVQGISNSEAATRL